jgi:pheromone shutdown-related protein TraB
VTEIINIEPNLDQINLPGKTIILVGTAHVSHASVELVQKAAEKFKPDSIAVELCQPRLEAITDAERWKKTDVVTAIRQGKGHLLLLQLILAGYQKKIAEELKITPGAEMLKAVEIAKNGNLPLILADREVKITLKRVWAALGFWSMLKLLLGGLLELIDGSSKVDKEEIERLKNGDMLNEVLKEFSDRFPTVRRALIDERDSYLAAKIRDSLGKVTLAVVGAGHVPGIKAMLNQEIDLKKLEEIPKPTLTKKVIQWGFPIFIVVLVVVVGIESGKGASFEMMNLWFWMTGLTAAIGAALALAHPLTVLAGFVSAPFTTLHPLIASGWVTALVEAWIRKPRVEDFEALADDISSVKGWYRNRVSRVLVVMLLTGLCGSIGMLLATGLLATWL